MVRARDWARAPAEPAPEQPAPEPRPEPAPAPAPVPVAEKPVPLREDIFFRIGSSEIRASERPKVEALADYLRAHPETTVSVTGYADAATGGKARNLQLSMLRAAGVSESRRTVSGSITRAIRSSRSPRRPKTA